MAPVDGSVGAAVQRGDVGWLCARLEAADCPPAVTGLLVRQDDARLRHLGWTLVAGRVADPRTEESELATLGELLPATLNGPPETALVLAGVYQRLWRYVAPQRRPRWRAAGLPVRVQLAWLRAEVVHLPATLRHEPVGEQLYQAVAGIGAADVPDPEALIRELVDRGDPVLDVAALRLTREALHAGLLAPARARGHVGRLVASPGAGVTALRELAEPWAALDPVPRERLRAFLAAGAAAGTAVTEAALAAAARHGHGDLLREVVADGSMPPAARQHALEALGDLAGRDDVSELTALAATDPLLLAGPAVACLRVMHRRGHFPGGDHAAAVVALALADHTIPADDVATIVFTCRREVFAELTAAGADDGLWPRRLDLLVALARQGGDDLPIGDAVTRALASTSRPEPFLAALRALRHGPAETVVIDVLPRAPEVALHALEAVGGPATVAALTACLGLSPGEGEEAEGIAPYLRPVRHRALELLWHLTDDPQRRQAILARLDPRDLPRRIAVDLGAADQRELAVLAADFAPDDPVAALVRLARNGDAGTLASIADLLLRIVAELAAGGPGGPDRPVAGGRSADRRDAEPAVPEEVVSAVHALGRRLHDRGKIRPACLLDAAGADAAGHALVATTALDLLDRADLSDRERAILLALLRHAPYAGTRARIHRLLRHRDRHVRKHAIALLTADVTGTDALALSASLIALTAAGDGQTVRQALLALGRVRARWAAPAIAAGLDHPAMNVKKTAAEALVHAGTPAAVPKLLFWLGHQDNPGLRGMLVEALRAILGAAYAATVLAAAERAGDDRSRMLLLTGLSGAISARAVDVLARQQSPAGPALLALVAAGRVELGSGSVDDLAVQLAAHGLTRPAGPPPATGGGPDGGLASLARHGWSAEVALQVVHAHERLPGQLPAGQAARVRGMLADWLQLAGAEPATRRAVLRFTLRICPAPWSAAEIGTFTRATQTLVTGLSGADGDDRDALVAVLEAVAPNLPAAVALDTVAQLRALPPAAGHRSLLTLLRGCGAVLTRADVEQSLTAVRLGANPWIAEADVLREAFERAAPGPGEVTAETRAWRLALDAAVRAPQSLAELRAHDDQARPSRERLGALIDAFPSAGRNVRAALLDWLEAIQPLDGPSWTLTEEACRPTPTPRTPHDGDLDQPRSAALRERLLAMLDAPVAGRRNAAALALLDWPEPRTGQALLRAFLHGTVDVPLAGGLARALAGADEAELRAATFHGDGADAARERAARLAFHLDPPDLHRLIPLLLEWWERGGPDSRAAAERALRRDPGHADAVAEHLRGRLDAGVWGYLPLLTGRPLLRTSALTRTCRRLRAEGRDDLADGLLLVDGPLGPPEAHQESALSALLGRPDLAGDPSAARPAASRRELLDLIRTGRPEQIRRALTHLAEAEEDDRPAGARPVTDQDPDLERLLAGLLHHPESRIRLHAHRVGRRLLDRPTYLCHTEILLDDPDPGTVRSAVRTLCHAAHQPAVPAIVGLLVHPHAGVRKAAATGLVQLGTAAVPALRHAAGRARPDRRRLYTAVLAQIADAEPASTSTATSTATTTATTTG